jgi:hypothetical protein
MGERGGEEGGQVTGGRGSAETRRVEKKKRVSPERARIGEL